MRKEDRFSPPATGGISLLVAFAVLCLTIFALLALTTVRAQSRLTDASVQSVKSYYNADCEALRILALLGRGELPEGVVENDGIYFYTCPISEVQVLEVEARIGEDGIDILRWQTVPEGQEAEDGEVNLNLWDGDNLWLESE